MDVQAIVEGPTQTPHLRCEQIQDSTCFFSFFLDESKSWEWFEGLQMYEI